MISVHYIGNFFFRLLLLSLLCVIHRGFMLSCSIGRTVLQPFYINSFCIIIIKWQTIVFFLSSIFCSIAWARRSKTIALLFSISRHMKRHITHILQLKPFFFLSLDWTIFFSCVCSFVQFCCSFFIPLRQMHIFHGCKPVSDHSFIWLYYNILCVCFFLCVDFV